MSLRTLALSSVFLLACGNEAPADAAKPDAAEPELAAGAEAPRPLPPNDPHAAPPPGDEPTPELPMMDSAPGSFDVTFDGKLSHYQRIPTGQNRAIYLPKDGVQRVTIAAAETVEGWPHVRLVLEGLRPDEVEYPLTISSTDEKGPSVTLRYQVGDKRIYQLNPEVGATAKVTLEAFEGSTLRGSFEGKVAPTAANLGDPVAIEGRFSVELGLRNVKPGPAPTKGSAPAEDAPAENAPAEDAPAGSAP